MSDHAQTLREMERACRNGYETYKAIADDPVAHAPARPEPDTVDRLYRRWKALEAAIAALSAPPQTCATCALWTGECSNGDSPLHEMPIHADMARQIGCILHQPAPPSSGARSKQS